MARPGAGRPGAGRPETGRSSLLNSLAAQALAQVADRARAARADPDGSALKRLHSAAIGTDPRACAEVARALIADGLSANRICDVHIPEAARRLGEDWVNDDLSFSDVTIGTARLQGLLRELDLRLEREAGHAAAGGGTSILLVVAPGADHTLGALVLASQLRRKGLSVRLSLGEAPEAMARMVAGVRFDAVFLSATIAGSMPFLIEAVAVIRAAISVPPPVVLGGALVALWDGDAIWNGARNGAKGGTRDGTRDGARGGARGGNAAAGAAFAGIDHVTCDLDDAIRFCGLTSATSNI